MKIGIYVGSFNPVHKGHIDVANKLIKNNYVDKIYIIPTLGYWNKNKLAPLNDRINMLKLVCSSNIIVDTINNELKYTYQIMDVYKKMYRSDDIKLIIGLDNLNDFHKWMNYDKILNYGLIVVDRNNIKTNIKYDNMIFALINPIQISSTEIRNNKKIRSKYLDRKVLKYINDNKLYK